MALPLRTNIDGEWLCNESGAETNVPDTSGNSRDLTQTGCTWVAGKIGNALSLGGSNDNAYAGNTTDFGYDISDAFSLEFWFNTSMAGYGFFLSKELGGASYRGYYVYTEGTTEKIMFGRIDSGSVKRNEVRTQTGSYNDGTWHHCVTVCIGGSGADKMKIYMDGSLAATDVVDNDANLIIMTSAATFRLGVRNDLANDYTGLLDIVRLWSTNLTSGEIASLYNGGAGIEAWTDPNTGSIGNKALYYYG